MNYVLGMEVIRDRSKRTITMTHRKMITELLGRFNMSDCKHSTTPLVPKEKIMILSEDPSVERASLSEHKRFMQAVGSIQYIAVVTRPDLAFAAHVLARHMARRAKKNWLAVQHVMRYLQRTSDVDLTFNGSGREDVVDVFSYADFANRARMNSVSGMVVWMYGNWDFWRSKRQEIIAWDTNEAELVAVSSTANELMWAKQLCTYLSLTTQKATLWGDSKSAYLLAVNPISSDRSKHIRVRR